MCDFRQLIVILITPYIRILDFYWLIQDDHIFILSQWINAVNKTVMIRILQKIQIDFQIKPRRSL
jgi:hypothetical protein